MRVPYVEDYSSIDIGLIGIPFDGAVTNRPGTRHGPRQVRDMSSMMRTTHHVSKINPYDISKIGDVGDVPLTNMYDLPTVNDQITSFYSGLVGKGVFPLSIGGDHSITYPILRAVAEKDPVGLVHIDAHTDTWDEWMGSNLNHGTPFRRAVEDGLLDPNRTIQIGIRGAQNSPEGWNFSRDSGMRIIFIEEFRKLGVEGVLNEIENVVGSGECYLSFDIDSIDPVYAPGTGTPEIGGLTPFEGQQLIRGLKGKKLVGADMVEVSPPFDQSGNTALVAATLVFEILCIVAEQIPDL
ncbi:MAG: agmatinase [Candidatus Neomarinimicrobiota bacterium]|nr:agmatinase [Candidatus Neomarinimicrobiota bacterium]